PYTTRFRSDMQTLDAIGHTATGEIGAQILDRVALGQEVVMCPLVVGTEVLIGVEAVRHPLHHMCHLEAGGLGGQAWIGEVVQGRERGAVLQPGCCHHNTGGSVRAPVGDLQNSAGSPPQLFFDREKVCFRYTHALYSAMSARSPPYCTVCRSGSAGPPVPLSGMTGSAGGGGNSSGSSSSGSVTDSQRVSSQVPRGSCSVPWEVTVASFSRAGSRMRKAVSPSSMTPSRRRACSRI